MSTDTQTKVIKSKAAVAWAPNELKIETIDVAPPKSDEVRVKMFAAAVCHTDIFALQGNDKCQKFPLVLGHEGAGIVESIGNNVKTVKPGDHVVPCFRPQCGNCKGCTHPSGTNICSKLPLSGVGLPVDLKTSYSLNNNEIYRFMGTGNFSQYVVLPEYAVAKIDESAPMDKICLLGCGVSTGYGAVMNTAKVTKGSTVAVWGLGTVGIACVMAAKEQGATTIIGFDHHDFKFELAKKFGATECFNIEELDDQKLLKMIDEKYDGGFDFVFEAVGDVKVMNKALISTRMGWGVCTILGRAAEGEELKIRPHHLLCGKTLKGTSFGG